MAYKMSATGLRHLRDAMLAKPSYLRPEAGARIMREIAAAGWAHASDVEDLILDADRRLGGFNHHVDMKDLGRALHLPLQHISPRPRTRSSSVYILDAWSAFDAAALFISLEMLGFAVDPTPLVKALKPTLPKAGYMPASALEVFWYDARRGKVQLTVEREDVTGPVGSYSDHVLHGGYKLTAVLDRAGEPMSLTVSGPRYRRRKPPVETLCPECNVTWYRGDPESSAMHRKEHRERMATLDPQPDARVLEERPFDEHVPCNAPEWKRREMYARALAFKREKHYDFVQWDVREADPNVHGFLFADEAGRIVGACAFRLRHYEGHAERWGLQWVWVARPYRRQGVLRARWASLRERFGDFHVEGPVSDAMQAFTRAAGDGHLLTIYEKAVEV